MGSGKTTLIRTWMAERSPWVAINAGGGAKRPVGWYHDVPERQLILAGDYDPDLQTSGCDMIKDATWWYAKVEEWWRAGHPVVYEGLFMMNHTRGLALLRACGGALTVLRLTTSLEECRAGVLARRAAQGNVEAVGPNFDKGLRDNNTRAGNYAFKMKQAGAEVLKVSRAEALPKLRELTGG